MRKSTLIIIFILALLMAFISTKADAQTAFYSEIAVANNPFNGSLSPVAYGAVRICTDANDSSLPCPLVAAVNGSSATPFQSFGQVQTDIAGRFTFSCTPGNYRLQIQAQNHNGAVINKGITCSTGSVFDPTQSYNFTGVDTMINLNGIKTVTTFTDAGIQATIDAASSGDVIYLPSGTYTMCNNLPVIITKTLQVRGAGWGTILEVCPTADVTKDVFLLRPIFGGEQLKGFKIADLRIQAQSGTPGRYGIHLDGTNKEIYDGLIDHVFIGQLGGAAVYAEGSGEAQGTPVLTTFQNSVFYGGLTFTNAGDTIRVINNQITGTGKAIDVNFQPGASTFIVEKNNITSDGGIFLGTSSVTAQIIGNEIETFPTFVGSNGAVIDVAGTGAAGNIIAFNSFQIVNGVSPNVIRIDWADNTQIYMNRFAGTPAKGVVTTTHPANTYIGPNVWTFSTDPALQVEDVSTSASIYSQGRLGVPLVIPNNKSYSAYDDAKNVQPVVGLLSDGTNMLYGFHGRKAVNGSSGATYFYAGDSGNNIAAVATTGVSALVASGTVFNVRALNINNSSGVIDQTGKATLGGGILINNVVAPTAGANQVGFGSTTATTVGAAGGAAALPATPSGYLIINVAGTNFKIPYYAN